jgi:hypothetical protein
MTGKHEPGCPYEHLRIAEAARRYGETPISEQQTTGTSPALEWVTRQTEDNGTDVVARMWQEMAQYRALEQQISAYGGRFYVRLPEGELQQFQLEEGDYVWRRQRRLTSCIVINRTRELQRFMWQVIDAGGRFYVWEVAHGELRQIEIPHISLPRGAEPTK